MTLGVALLSSCSADEGDASRPETPSSGAVDPSRTPAASSAPSASPQETAGGDVSQERLPGGVTLPDEEQGALLGEFVNFALRPDTTSAETVPFADQVDLGVGAEVKTTLSGSDLGNPQRWRVPLDGYAGGSGDTSALQLIAGQGRRALRQGIDTGIFAVTSGAHPRCTADPGAPLGGYSVDQQLAVMPGARSIDACLQWFAVDLYTDDAGDIAAVRVDLFEP